MGKSIKKELRLYLTSRRPITISMISALQNCQYGLWEWQWEAHLPHLYFQELVLLLEPMQL